jgi:hypothetical protein
MREDYEVTEAQTTERAARELFGSDGIRGHDAVTAREAADRAAKFTMASRRLKVFSGRRSREMKP